MNSVLEMYLKVFSNGSALSDHHMESPMAANSHQSGVGAAVGDFLHAVAVKGVALGQLEEVLKENDDNKDGYLTRVQLYNVRSYF